MSSMKSFKSRISQKGKNNQSRGNVSVSESVGEYNLKNLYTNSMDKIEFSLKRQGNQVKVIPFELQVMNGTGTRIFLHMVSSKQDYFTIHPKKYILENGSSIKIDLKLNEISYVQLDDYQAQSFQLSWGKITQEQIAQKKVPKLTQARVFKCLVKNKEILNEYLAKKTYQSRHKIENNLNVEKDDERGFLNAFDPSKVQQFARSGLNTSDIKTNKDLLNNRPSLLTKNILIPVAVISFIIGFISA